MRPISLAVDVTNYVMLELGRPIHGYDADKLQGPIRVRRASEGERLTTLDGADRALSTEDLVVTDDSGIIGLGGVMGGETTEMSATTTNVLVEAAHWDAVVDVPHRQAAQAHLRGRQAQRARRRPDDHAEAAADRVVELLDDVRRRHRRPGRHRGRHRRRRRPPITIAYDLPARVTGMPIDAATTVANLEAVGCALDKDDTALTATAAAVAPRPHRPLRPGRGGRPHRRLRPRCPRCCRASAAGRGLTREQRLRRRVGRTLAGAGCVEVVSFPFVGDAAFDALGLPADDPLRRTVRLANPLSSEEPSYTTTLLPGLLKAGGAQPRPRCRRGVALFETGTVAFPVDRGPAPIYGVDWRPSDDELAKLLDGAPRAAAAPRRRPGRRARARRLVGRGPRGRLGRRDRAGPAARRASSGSRSRSAPPAATPWHPGRCAQVRVGGVELGHAGELHPQVCAAFGLPRAQRRPSRSTSTS